MMTLFFIFKSSVGLHLNWFLQAIIFLDFSKSVRIFFNLKLLKHFCQQNLPRKYFYQIILTTNFIFSKKNNLDKNKINKLCWLLVKSSVTQSLNNPIFHPSIVRILFFLFLAFILNHAMLKFDLFSINIDSQQNLSHTKDAW